MKRVFWNVLGFLAGFFVGFPLGAWAMYRLTRLARGWTSRGVTARAVGLGGRLRAYAGDIRAETRTREAQLRDALGLAGIAAQPRGEWHDGQRRDGHLPRSGTVHGQVLHEDKDGH